MADHVGDVPDVVQDAVLVVILKVEELLEEVTELVELRGVEVAIHIRDKVLKACHVPIETLTA